MIEFKFYVCYDSYRWSSYITVNELAVLQSKYLKHKVFNYELLSVDICGRCSYSIMVSSVCFFCVVIHLISLNAQVFYVHIAVVTVQVFTQLAKSHIPNRFLQ